ncbi:MAG: DUF2007 domain-containing protein [Aeoliella sp.]
MDDRSSVDATSVIEVYRAAHSLEAHAVRNLLAGEGIDARVVGEGLDFAQGGVPVGHATSPRVIVSDADHERASTLVNQWRFAQLKRAENASTAPFQFSLGLMFANTTAIALIAALAQSLGPEGWRRVALPMIMLLMLGNLMYLAYYRKRIAADGTHAIDDEDDDWETPR